MHTVISIKPLQFIKYASYFTVALCVHSSQPSFADTELTIDNSVIDAREQELRRKEQELLQGLDLNAASAATSAQDEIPAVQPAKDVTEENNKVTVLEIKAPEPKVAEEYAPGNVAVEQVAKPAPLRELEKHPAIAPKPQITSVPYVTNNRVRTHSNDSYPDGTTARRVGSFYKIDRSKDVGLRGGESAKSHTVSIEKISREARTRPALLTSDMAATISNSSTFLKTGPRKSDSSLSKISRDSEVKIDYRSGAWYRVKTDAGARGWVSGGSLEFGGDVPPGSTVKVRGIQDSRR
jgi:hypothetical protein